MMNAGSTSGVVVEKFGKTKIEHLRLALTRHHNVPGLDVAMDYSLGMGNGQCVRNLNSNRQGALKLQRFAVYQLPHVAAGNVLHRDEVDAVDDVEVKNRTDVGMIQS